MFDWSWKKQRENIYKRLWRAAARRTWSRSVIRERKRNRTRYCMLFFAHFFLFFLFFSLFLVAARFQSGGFDERKLGKKMIFFLLKIKLCRTNGMLIEESGTQCANSFSRGRWYRTFILQVSLLDDPAKSARLWSMEQANTVSGSCFWTACVPRFDRTVYCHRKRDINQVWRAILRSIEKLIKPDDSMEEEGE